jgi:hypothetical protein
MRQYVFGAVVTLVAVAGAAPAQAPDEPAPVVQGSGLEVAPAERPDPERNWVRADFGGQLGAEAEYQSGGLLVDVLGKVALGATLAETDATGNGFQVEPSNHGRHHHSEFAVVPEAEVRAGYQFGTHLRVSVGYDFLLLSNVFRPGDQIDPAINTSQIGGAVPTGPTRPAFPAHDTTFWAQGINFGLELRF